MVRVGIAGIGFMGMIHYLAYRKTAGAQVAAVCSRSEKKLAGDWRDIKGNFGPPGEQMDLSGLRRYRELDEMLADPELDVVDVCLPPAMHADTAVAALQAGKHVLCEKPITLTTGEADRMVAAAQSAGKMLMIAHVLPFFPEYAYARQAVANGQHGRLLGGHFKRIISDPSWLKEFFDPTKVGGPVVDLHIHDAHFIRLLCGMPRGVFSSGWERGEVVEFVNTQFLYDNPRYAVTASSGVIRQQGRAFTHAFEIYLEKATLTYDFAVIDGQAVLSMPLTVLHADGRVERPQLGSGDPVDAFVAELNEMAAAVEQGQPSAILGGMLARDALVLCHKQSESVRGGREVAV